MIRPYLKAFIFMMTVTYFVACSPVKFDKLPEQGDCQNVGGQRACIQSCDAQGSCFAQYDVQRRVGQGVADILVINDNSGSMSYEQQRMADGFPTFISTLSGIDYRLAMTTTDVSGVSPSPSGGTSPMSASLRDGALIDFSSGLKFLSPAQSASQADNLFKATVRRQETLSCEQSNFAASQCPSQDERGIYAANLALARNDGGFIRAGGHLAVIVLADEDLRSDLYCAGNNNNTTPNVNCMTSYNLSAQDTPQSFLDTVRTRFPGKTVTVHSIVVKDANCQNIQSSQPGNVGGSIGTQYINLSSATGGVQGSICDSNYQAQLGQIGSTIVDQISNVAFECSPYNGQFELYLNGQPAQSSQYTVDLSRLLIDFTQSLPANTQIQLKYQCKIR